MRGSACPSTKSSVLRLNCRHGGCIAGVARRIVDEGPARALRRDQSVDSVARAPPTKSARDTGWQRNLPTGSRTDCPRPARCRNCNRSRSPSWWSSRSGNTHRAACWFFARVQPAADSPAACPENRGSGKPATRSRRTRQTKRWKPPAACAASRNRAAFGPVARHSGKRARQARARPAPSRSFARCRRHNRAPPASSGRTPRPASATGKSNRTSRRCAGSADSPSRLPSPAPCRAATTMAAPRIGRIVSMPGHRASGRG